MKHYEITYIYEGQKYATDVFPQKGWEAQYHKNVLDKIESLVSAGAVIIDIIETC